MDGVKAFTEMDASSVSTEWSHKGGMYRASPGLSTTIHGRCLPRAAREGAKEKEGDFVLL